MENKSNEKAFKELEKIYKQNNISKKVENWIFILKVTFVLTSMVAIGWFIGSIIVLEMECGG